MKVRPLLTDWEERSPPSRIEKTKCPLLHFTGETLLCPVVRYGRVYGANESLMQKLVSDQTLSWPLSMLSGQDKVWSETSFCIRLSLAP